MNEIKVTSSKKDRPKGKLKCIHPSKETSSRGEHTHPASCCISHPLAASSPALHVEGGCHHATGRGGTRTSAPLCSRAALHAIMEWSMAPSTAKHRHEVAEGRGLHHRSAAHSLAEREAGERCCVDLRGGSWCERRGGEFFWEWEVSFFYDGMGSGRTQRDFSTVPLNFVHTNFSHRDSIKPNTRTRRREKCNGEIFGGDVAWLVAWVEAAL